MREKNRTHGETIMSNNNIQCIRKYKYKSYTLRKGKKIRENIREKKNNRHAM